MSHHTKGKNVRRRTEDDQGPEDRRPVPAPSEPRYVEALFPRAPGTYDDTHDTTSSYTPSTPASHQTPAVQRSPLSQDGRLFATEVKIGDILGITDFLNDHPQVLKEAETDRKYSEIALSLLKRGEPDLKKVAESYIEKCIILKHCHQKSPRETMLYLKALANGDKSTWSALDRDVDRLSDHLKAQAKLFRDQLKVSGETTDVTVRFAQLSTDADSRQRRHGGGAAAVAIPSEIEVAGRKGGKYHGRGAAQAETVSPIARDRDDDEQYPGSEFSLGRAPTFRGNSIPTAVEHGNSLDPNYQRCKNAKEAGGFFRIGRVFSMLYHQEKTGNKSVSAKWTRKVMGIIVFSHIGYFVVVKEGHGYAKCVPVSTYGRRGVTKDGLNWDDKDAHAIIHMEGTKPKPMPNEHRFSKIPIVVTPARHRSVGLDEASRINFAKTHTVEHNVTIRDVGVVTSKSLPYLIHYWDQHK